jgi:transporter family-2 protein
MFLKVEPWAFTGGILGALFVLTTVISVPAIGTGLTIMMALIGQVVGSILVQQFGLWKSKQTSVQLKQILGILIMVVGIVLIKFL